MSSITKSIQNEYVLLMENAFSEKYKYAFRNLELKEWPLEVKVWQIFLVNIKHIKMKSRY